jgi:hypothetical protein
VGKAGLTTLANSPAFAGLTTLDLLQTGDGADGARAVAESPHLRRLTSLSLGFQACGDAPNYIGAEGIRHLAWIAHRAPREIAYDPCRLARQGKQFGGCVALSRQRTGSPAGQAGRGPPEQPTNALIPPDHENVQPVEKVKVMSKPHLCALESALMRRGWRIVTVHPGDGYRIAATWELQRSSRQPSQFIDFDGMGPEGEYLPLEASDGCAVRGRTSVSLYFRRATRSGPLGEQELAEFVRALDNEADTEPIEGGLDG